MILTITWAVGVVVFVYPISHIIAHSMAYRGDPEGDDWVFGTLLGTLLSTMWPVLLAIVSSWFISKRIWTGKWDLPKIASRDKRVWR